MALHSSHVQCLLLSALVILVMCVSESYQQRGKLDHGIIEKPSRLSALVLLEPPRYYDLSMDCVAGANLRVSNAKCGCSEFICLLNYKFNRLRSIQNCHEECCKRRSIKSLPATVAQKGSVVATGKVEKLEK